LSSIAGWAARSATKASSIPVLRELAITRTGMLWRGAYEIVSPQADRPRMSASPTRRTRRWRTGQQATCFNEVQARGTRLHRRDRQAAPSDGFDLQRDQVEADARPLVEIAARRRLLHHDVKIPGTFASTCSRCRKWRDARHALLISEFEAAKLRPGRQLCHPGRFTDSENRYR